VRRSDDALVYNADVHLEILQDVLHLDNGVMRDSKVRQRLVQLLVEVHGVLSRLVEQAGTKHIISRLISNNGGTEGNGGAWWGAGRVLKAEHDAGFEHSKVGAEDLLDEVPEERLLGVDGHLHERRPAHVAVGVGLLELRRQKEPLARRSAQEVGRAAVLQSSVDHLDGLHHNEARDDGIRGGNGRNDVARHGCT
jgi:hypothetical protein